MIDENSSSDLETNEIITDLPQEAKLKLEVIQTLMEPCDRHTYGKRLSEAATKLGCSRRTVQRLVTKWEKEGLKAFISTARADKGQHHIELDLVDYTIKTYIDGNKGSRRISRAQVAMRVQARAAELGIKAPSHMTVYRILEPIIKEQQKPKGPRNSGWRGSTLSIKTKAGNDIEVCYSNHVWQCDHTRADIMLVDQYGELLGRPWLTIIVDTYSRCVVGMNIGFDAPSSEVVALALRHAILPKHYSADYQLNCEWGTYGKPEYLFTDSGKDFKSNHAQQIAAQLGISWQFRLRPSEGGVVERIFGTLNKELFSTLPGYTGSSLKERPEEAEKEATVTLPDLERLLVRYIVDRYNQSIDARMGEQSRFQRWEAGLTITPDPINERDLDICLMRQTRRTVYDGGYVHFENLTYKGENLGAYSREKVVLRYDPRDITTIFIYHQEKGKEVFLARGFAQDLETESISLEEAKASSRRVREKGKTISNKSILAEVRDRELFIKEKKSRKQKQKDEQTQLKSKSPLIPLVEEESMTSIDEIAEVSKPRSRPKILDYQELLEDYGL